MNFENQEDILQEEPDQLFLSMESESMLIISEEEDVEFLSSTSPQVITIGNNDDEVETAEQVLSVDNADVRLVAKQDKGILLWSMTAFLDALASLKTMFKIK